MSASDRGEHRRAPGAVAGAERDRRWVHGAPHLRGHRGEVPRGVRRQGGQQAHLQIPQRGELPGQWHFGIQHQQFSICSLVWFWPFYAHFCTEMLECWKFMILNYNYQK